MIRLLLASVLVAGMALPALAAGPAKGEVLAGTQSYAFWLPTTPATLDPQKATTPEETDIIRQLFEGLLNAGAGGAPVPGVATGFELSADRLTYTFQLRPDARWSDGAPVTAEDFVHAWRRLADPATASEAAGFAALMQIENATAVVKGQKKPAELGVKAVDAHTFEVRLTRPTPHFPKLVTHVATFPVNRKALAAGEDWTRSGKLVGNGAYVLKAHELGRQITLERNPAYWDAAHVVMARLQGQVVTDPAAALARYLAGGLDRASIPEGQYRALRERFPTQAVALPRPCSYAFLINLGDKAPKALKDVRVRRALAHATPRDEVVAQVLQGGQKPAHAWTHWAIEGFRMPESSQADWTRDKRLEQARALLAEAGYGPGKPLRLTLSYNTDATHQQIATATQRAYAGIGVDLRLSDAPWKTQAERLRSGDFELARFGWCADYNDASSFLDLFRTNGGNYGGYANPAFDGLLDQAGTSADPGAQYAAAEAILAGDMPLIPVYHFAGPEMIRDDMRGLPTGNAMNTWYGKDLYRIQK